MGVRGLMPLLARFAPKSISMPAEQDLSRWVVAVDSNIYVQRFFRGTDGGSDEARHLRGMYNMAKYLRAMDITPLFVFDGKERALGKESELAKRREDRMRILQELERENARARRIHIMAGIAAQLDGGSGATGKQAALQSEGEAAKEQPRQATVEWLGSRVDELTAKEQPRQITIDWRMNRLELETCRLLLFRLGALQGLEGTETASLDCTHSLHALQTHNAERTATLGRRGERLTAAKIGQCEELMRALGFATHVVDGGESEGVCAQLCRGGVVDAVCSEDLDVVAFGGRLLRGLYSFDPRVPMALVDAERACEELGLSRESFVDLCILCGTDFASTIEKVGPITALRLVREHGSIEHILESEKFVARPGFTYELARAVFLADPASLPFASKAQLRACTGPPDPQAVNALLPSGAAAGPGNPDPFASGLVLV
ncbi:hypothetical protein IWW50_002449 [Coemansia erecta]|nr:hypothetical protein IWW50_002449 [Coemansia erecta]